MDRELFCGTCARPAQIVCPQGLDCPWRPRRMPALAPATCTVNATTGEGARWLVADGYGVPLARYGSPALAVAARDAAHKAARCLDRITHPRKGG